MRVSGPLILSGLLIFSPGRAQNAASLSVPPVPAAPSEFVAFAWTAAGTLLPALPGIYLAESHHAGSAPFDAGMGLLAGGSIVGPALGEYDAGSTTEAALGILGRAAGWSLLAGALLAGDCDSGAGCALSTAEVRLAVSGAVVVAAVTAYSLAETHFAILRRQENARARAFRFDVIPEIGFIPDRRSPSDPARFVGAKAVMSF